ncbi:hypothetical protein JMA_37960 (plasmid) [Jeotgalibacillus malaysiensis]|uniref:GTP pyrophosphokinase n=1 Tax=Jeotgalibacillus malaysiensis TaxID=1508404 RepID=A0A0B5AYN8_9BACL|nr:hypothetical protein [Jeotgalibacillus malaysiensis]AJD93114.1 hypothetical protein JMA_37960 [Jeotgalibacillus malaysiensis]
MKETKGSLSEFELMVLKHRAYELATKYHDGQVDKLGIPYIGHLEAVAQGVDKIEEKIVALIHDILEDTPCTREILLAEGIPAYLVKSIEAMTRRPGETYKAFIERVARDAIARAVKRSDLKHNLDEDGSRLKAAKDFHQRDVFESLPPASLKARYRDAIAYLDSLEQEKE